MVQDFVEPNFRSKFLFCLFTFDWLLKSRGCLIDGSDEKLFVKPNGTFCSANFETYILTITLIPTLFLWGPAMYAEKQHVNPCYKTFYPEFSLKFHLQGPSNKKNIYGHLVGTCNGVSSSTGESSLYPQVLYLL